PELLRAYLECATYQLEADGRPEWAARTLSHGLVPLLVETKAPPEDIAEVLGRAAGLAERAHSHFALESVFRMAHKSGYTATLTQLSQFAPPVFAYSGSARSPSPVIAVAPALVAVAAAEPPPPAAAPAAPAEAPAAAAVADEKPGKKKGKKKKS